MRLFGVSFALGIDKIGHVCYYVCVMKRITNTIKNKYYIYQRGEFLPVYMDGELANKREFHIYKAKRAVKLIHYYFRVVSYEIKQAQQ